MMIYICGKRLAPVKDLPDDRQVWVFNGIKDKRSRLLFDLPGIDSDNGSEFINAHLLRYSQSKGITFIRSRAYRKNDSCHVEQKNYTAVKQYVGYFRYDTEEELNIMNELYRNLSLYLNYFHPVMKLKTKAETCKYQFVPAYW